MNGVVVRRLAKQDIRQARAWYRKVSRVLADDFLKAVDDAMKLAVERPLAFQVVHRTFRRILRHRFPYAMFYDVGDNDSIVVVAVLHQARNPEILRQR